MAMSSQWPALLHNEYKQICIVWSTHLSIIPERQRQDDRSKLEFSLQANLVCKANSIYMGCVAQHLWNTSIIPAFRAADWIIKSSRSDSQEGSLRPD